MKNNVAFYLFAALWVSCAIASATTAKELLKWSEVQGGLIVHLGCGAGELTAALRANERYLVHGLDADLENIRAARAHIQDKGLYGPVSVEQRRGNRLPYAENTVNLLITESPGTVLESEIMRVLAPRGVACVKHDNGWQKTVKPVPDSIDEWTHFLYDASNNAVSHDSAAGPPERIQWVTKPMTARSHEIVSGLTSLVTAQGRVFYIYDEGLIGITDERLPSQWALVARDAFNGVLLWKKRMPEWGWREWDYARRAGEDWTAISGGRGKIPDGAFRRLVAAGDKIYTTLAYVAPLVVLDATTGEALQTCENTNGTDEILHINGTVLACLRNIRSEQQARRTGKRIPETIVALDAETGEERWRHKARRVLPNSLAALDGRVVYCDGPTLVGLDLESGAPRWTSADKVSGAPVLYKDVALVRADGRITAYSLESGARKWDKGVPISPGATKVDLLVANGLVWSGGPTPGLITDPATYWDQPFDKPRSPETGVHMIGLDPSSGETAQEIQVTNLVSPGHHFRCYRSKATDNFILWPKRGIEFIDLKGVDHKRHDWVRGICRYGIMPANGLIYAPPNQCFCYQGVLLRGFNALAPAATTQPAGESGPRLVHGPAYGNVESKPAKEAEWPTFRHDAKRSGSAATALAVDLESQWTTKLGGRLTQPVAAAQMVFTASIDEHAVYALNHETGDKIWRFDAGGRVDSPPTYHDGFLLFGAADGWVYCLRARDGQLVWRFRAAPEERRIVAFDQLESAWPAHGSVLIQNGLAYTAAGRSSYLDGGIHVYALNPQTGEIVHHTCLDGPHPDLTKDIGKPFSMDGVLSDVLVSDGSYLYMMQAMMDGKLNQLDPERITNMGDKKFGRHIYSTAGFLNDDWWNRAFWMYAERWPGFYIGHQASKEGQLLVFDATTTYGVKCYTKRNVHSPMFFPGQEGYLFFADDNDAEPALVGDPGVETGIRSFPHQYDRDIIQIDFKTIDIDKSTGFVRTQESKWTNWMPLRGRAMAAAQNALFIAGPPDVLDPADPLAAFEGRKGGSLVALSKKNGKRLAEYELDSPPVFDGMSAANGHLYLAARDGSLTCYGEH